MATNGPLGFEDTLWKAADKLRGSMDASEYKHVVLGLVFLKYVDDAFLERRGTVAHELREEDLSGAEADRLLETRDVYTAGGKILVPLEARWAQIQATAKQPRIGGRIDAAMETLGAESHSLKGRLPKSFARRSLDLRRLGELIDHLERFVTAHRGRRSDFARRSGSGPRLVRCHGFPLLPPVGDCLLQPMATPSGPYQRPRSLRARFLSQPRSASAAHLPQAVIQCTFWAMRSTNAVGKG